MNTKRILSSIVFNCTPFLLALFAAHSAAFAQGTSGSPFTMHTVSPGPVVNIGNAASPIPIDLDPTGGPWSKSISDPNSNVVGIQNMEVVETISNAGTEPWTDWHEIILPPPSGLVPATWTNVLGLTVNGNPIGFTASGIGTQTLDLFNFSQPVLPGNVFGIRKVILVDGNSDANGGPLIRLREYPTTVPEPANISFLALLAFASLRTRKRCRVR